MRQTSVINDLLNAITDPGALFAERRKPRRVSRDELRGMIDAILSGRGEVSLSEKAATFLTVYRDLDSAGRTFVFRTLANDYGPDPKALADAANAYLNAPDEAAAKALQRAAEPRRVEFFRQLNLVQGGTQALVAMRLEILERMVNHPDLWPVDADLKALFVSWFNRGFLVLREINWQTSAAILEKIIRYEAVHAINGWDDLRLRIDKPDRRLYAFFHPRLGDEPLIFVEVALTAEIPGAIAPILEADRTPIDPRTATTAVFYSISNCQDGLRGISFGAFLIKRVADTLSAELPNLKIFVTLSPVPGFADWLKTEAQKAESALDEPARQVLSDLAEAPNWLEDPAIAKTAEAALMPLAAHYLTQARDHRDRLADPVARFHLGNGARLEQLNFAADRSRRGHANAHGIMVNYRYILADVEKNHEAFVNEGKVVAAGPVNRLANKVKVARRETAQDGEPPRLPAPDAVTGQSQSAEA